MHGLIQEGTMLIYKKTITPIEGSNYYCKVKTIFDENETLAGKYNILNEIKDEQESKGKSAKK